MRVSDALVQELKKCGQIAQEGYKLASKHTKVLEGFLREEKKNIKGAKSSRKNISRLGERNADRLFVEQEKDLCALESMVEEVGNTTNLLHKQQKEFSILLFGRTMAGKSTLMEILTHGNGQSIGHGQQRTTRDIRSYHWNGLKIIDVPGICAFEGDEDDRLAIEAAKTADMIIFLITDDAPQRQEAERLAELCSYGKPVLCVMNVKMGITLAQNRKLALKNIEKKLTNIERLQSIRAQFCEYGKAYGQDWERFGFVYTHLQAAYLGQQCTDKSGATDLYEVSNFERVEQFILDTVRDNGAFWRVKTFIDSVSVPVHASMKQMYEHSTNNVRIAFQYSAKNDELVKWEDDFVNDGCQQIDSFIKTLEQQIEKEIDEFSFNNYNNENAGKDWNTYYKSLHIDKKCEMMLKRLSEECQRKLHEFSDELCQDIRFSSTTDISIDYAGSNDDGVANLVTIASAGVGLAAAVGLVTLGPIGWGITAISFLTSIFGDTEDDKKREARRKLANAIKESMGKVFPEIENQLLGNFNKTIVNEAIGGFSRQLISMNNLLIDLANAQLALARHLTKQYMELNSELFAQACEFKAELHNQRSKHYPLYRVPGKEIMLVLPKYGGLYAKQIGLLGTLFGEKTLGITSNEADFDSEQFIRSLLDNQSIKLELDKNNPIIRVFGDLNSRDEVKLDLAQQMEEKLIMVEK